MKDNYVKLSNKILESLCKTRVPALARQLFDVITRLTYGYNKKESIISIDEICLLSNLTKQAVIKARNTLSKMNLISVTQQGYNKPHLYRINKNPTTWNLYPCRVTLKKESFSCLNKNIPVTQQGYNCNPTGLQDVTQQGYTQSLLYKDKEKTCLKTCNTKKKINFLKPQIEELKIFMSNYAKEKEISIKKNTAEDFFDYYEGNGWHVGKVKMKKWKSTAQRWVRKTAEWNNPIRENKKDWRLIDG